MLSPAWDYICTRQFSKIVQKVDNWIWFWYYLTYENKKALSNLWTTGAYRIKLQRRSNYHEYKTCGQKSAHDGMRAVRHNFSKIEIDSPTYSPICLHLYGSWVFESWPQDHKLASPRTLLKLKSFSLIITRQFHSLKSLHLRLNHQQILSFKKVYPQHWYSFHPKTYITFHSFSSLTVLLKLTKKDHKV